MNTKTKTTALIIVTLLIGVAIGFLARGAINYGTFRPPHKVRSPEGFTNAIKEIIQPTPAQEKQVNQILKDFGEYFEATMKSHRAEMTGVMDSLDKKFEPILTPEQLDRLKSHRKKAEKWHDRKPSNDEPH